MENLVEIPWQELQGDTLYRLVEEFVTRDGTDYGAQEVAVEVKVKQVIAGLKRKEYIIIFDPQESSTHICAGPFSS